MGETATINGEATQEVSKKTLTSDARSASKKLLLNLTQRYEQVSPLMGLRFNVLDENQPLFRRFYIPAMLRDPHLWYGVQILRGPILSKTKYEVKTEDEDLAAFVTKQLDRFINCGLSEALTAMEWGFCGCEVLYKFNPEIGVVEYDNLKFLHPLDTKPKLVNGILKGFTTRGIRKESGEKVIRYIPIGKGLWTVHERRHDRWYGRSRLEGAFIPWYETWQAKGYRAIRHLGLYKYSFGPGVIKYPEGATYDPDTSTNIPNALIAQEMLDLLESGASIAMPSSILDKGGWEYEPPKALMIPEALFMYGDSLRDEKWEGIGVPPEVAKSEGTGSFSGRRVPQQAFYSFLQSIANEIIFDFNDQVLRYLVLLAYGPNVQYELAPVSILLTLQQEEMGLVTGDLEGEEGEEGEEGNKLLSNGRVEDRDSNAHNKQEKSIKKNSGN